MKCEEHIREHCVARKCDHLDLNGSCMVPDNKPVECRLYPLDLAVVGNVLYWIMWPTCPNFHLFNTEMMCNIAEAELAKAPDGWIDKYLSSKTSPPNSPSNIIGPVRTKWRPPEVKENP